MRRTIQMATKTKALAVVPDEEEAAAPKPLPQKPIPDDKGNELNPYNGEMPNTVSKTAAAQEHKALLNAVKGVEGYLEEGEQVYQDFYAALENAYADNIHIHYGYKTFTEYCNEYVQVQLPKYATQQAARMLSDWGVSQRAIASALKTSQTSISRALDGTDSDESVDPDAEPKTTVGIDGRTTKRRGKAAKEDEPEADSDIIDAEVVELPKTGTLPKRFAAAVTALDTIAEQFAELAEVKSFTANRKKFAEAHGETLVAAVNSILAQVDALGLYDEIGLEEDEDEADEDAPEDDDEAEDEDDEAAETEDEAEEFEEDEDDAEDEDEDADEDEDDDEEDF
jgi:hypothetical protein